MCHFLIHPQAHPARPILPCFSCRQFVRRGPSNPIPADSVSFDKVTTQNGSFSQNPDIGVLASYMKEERKGKERKGIYVLMEKKIPFVGLEPTPSAIRADVLIQLD